MLETYFNSIKVQLELNVNNISEKNHLFQFHKGTIRTTSIVNLKLFCFAISIP